MSALRKPMATTSAPRPAVNPSKESAEARFQRLLSESRDLRPRDGGTAEEIKRDTISTLKTWSRIRRRANKIA
jgi:hypothetical protein